METEAETPEDISAVMKIKDLDLSHLDNTVSKVENEHSSLPDTVGNSTEKEVLEVTTAAKVTENHVVEDKVGFSEGESFLNSPSVTNVVSEEICRASGVGEDKDVSNLVEKKTDNVIQLGDQNSASTNMENRRGEEETANSASEMENVEECIAEKFPSISPSIEHNVQKGKIEDGKDEVVEEKKLVENSQAVHDEQTLDANCATQSVQEEEVVTDSKKDEIEGKMSSEGPSFQSREVGQRIQATPDHNQEASSLDLIKETLVNDDKSAGDIKNMEVSTDKNIELVARSNEEDEDKNSDSQNIPIKQEVEKTNSEEVTEIKEQEKPSNLLGTEEIENDKKVEVENPQASLTGVLEDEGTTSHKLDIPCYTTATEEVRSLKAETEESGTAEYISSLSLEEKREADNAKEEMSKGLETADSNEYIDKDIIQDDEAIKSQSTITFVEEKVQSSQEDEKLEEHEIEVSEVGEVDEGIKDTEEQIIEEHDVVKDHCTVSTVEETVKENNQEDEKEAKEFEKEDCTGTTTTIANEDIQISASEDRDSVKDQHTVSLAEETIRESSHEDEKAKTPELEVFEELETNGASEDMAKIIEDGVVTHQSTAPIGEEAMKETSQEEEACKELETTGGGEGTVNEYVHELGAVTDASDKAIGEVTTTDEVTTTEECIAEKFPSISPAIEHNVQEGKIEDGKDEVVEEKKLVENSQAVHDEQTLDANCATQSVQEEEVVTDSKKDEIEGKMPGEGPSFQSREQVGQRIQATPDHNQEASSLDLIKETLVNDDKSAGDIKNMEVSTDKNIELVARSNDEDEDKNWDSQNIPIKQEVEKTNSEEVTEIKEQEKPSNLLGTEEIENDQKVEVENPQASLTGVLEDEGTTSHKLDIPCYTTATEEVRSLKAESEESGTAEYASSLVLEEKKEADNIKEEMSKGLETESSNEYPDKTVIQEDEAIKRQSTVNLVEATVQNSQEDEKVEEKHETEVSEERKVDEASKNFEEQIVEEGDLVKDSCTVSTVEETVKESHHEDEKEVYERFEGAVDGKVTEKQIIEKITATDLPTVSLEDETISSSQVNEVSKELETTGAGVDTVKESVDEHGAVTNICAKAIEEETTMEDYIGKTASENNNAVTDHRTVSAGEGTVEESSQEDEKAKESVDEHVAITDTCATEEFIGKTSSEDNNTVTDHCTVSAGEETVNESFQEDEAKNPEVEVFKGLETNDANEETTKQIIEDSVVTHHSTSSIGEETIKESSQEDEVRERIEGAGDGKITESQITKEEIAATDLPVITSSHEEACKELETTGGSEDAMKESVEEHAAVTDIGEVATKEETTKESSQEDEEAKKPEGEVFEGLEINGASEETAKHIIEDDVATYLSTTSIDEETIKKSSQEDEVHEKIEEVKEGNVTEEQIIQEIAATDVPTISSGEETVRSSQEDEVCKEVETTGPSENAVEESVEEHGAVTNICAVATGEMTTIEDSKEEEKEAKTQEEVEELKSTDCTQNTETERRVEEDPNKIPTTSVITEASGEEIRELNENLAGSSLESEVSEEHTVREVSEKEKVTGDKQETEYVSIVNEQISLNEAEPEGAMLIDASDVLSKEMSPLPIEANGTSLQALQDEDVKIEENPKSDENALKTDSTDAEGAKDEMKDDMTLGSSVVPVPESDDHETEITSGTEMTGVMDPPNNEPDKLQETPTLSSNQQDPKLVEANEMIKDEIQAEDKIHDEKSETPVVAQTKKESSTQKEETCEVEETSDVSENTGKESPNEELQEKVGENKPPESKDVDTFVEEISDTSNLAIQQKKLETIDTEEKITDEYTAKDEIQERNEMEFPEIVKAGDEEVLEKSSQKDEMEVNKQERCIDLVSKEPETVDSSAYNEKITSDQGEGAEKKPEESFEEERTGGESSEIEHTRETELQKEVENFTDLASMQQNLKQVDSCEKIQSTDIDDSYEHKEDLSIPSLEPRVEINDEDGQEEAHQATEATRENKSTETDNEETDGLAASGLMQTTEIERVSLEEINPAKTLIGSDGEDEPVNNLEEDKKGGDLCDIDHTRETELQNEVENNTDLESMHEDLKPADACERIRSAETGGPYNNEDDSSISNLKPTEEINKKNGQEEAQVIEATEESKSPETETWDHDKAEELAASGPIQIIEMECATPEAIDLAEKLRGTSESVAENQSYMKSNEDHVIGQSTQEEHMESKKLEETVTKLEPEEQNHSIYYASETTKNCIPSEKVPEDAEKACESEEIEKQISEEEVASKEHDIVSIRDEAIKEVIDSELVPSEENLEVTDSNEKTETATIPDEENCNSSPDIAGITKAAGAEVPKIEDSEKLLEVSTLIPEVYEEHNKETDDTSRMVKTESAIVAAEETSTQEAEPQVEKIASLFGVVSEEKNLERVETAEISLIDDGDKVVKLEDKSELVCQPPITENESEKLEEKSELVSQPLTTEDGNQNQEGLIVEKLDANKFEEEIKDELMVASDPESQREELIIDSDDGIDRSTTAETLKEKLHRSSALVSETQELEISATEKIEDNPTIDDASEVTKNGEIEAIVDQNVEADKEDIQEIQVPVATREIKAEVQVEDAVSQREELIIDSDDGNDRSKTAEKLEEKLHESSALVSETQALEISATEKIEDNPTIDNASEVTKNREIETIVDQNVEADKEDIQEIQVPVATREIKAEVQVEDEVQDEKNMDALFVTNTEEATCPHKEEESKELLVSDVGFEDAEETPNVDPIKEGENLETAPNFVPGDNVSESKDVALILERKEELAEPREDIEKDNLKDDKSMETGERKQESENKGPEKCFSGGDEENEAGGASADLIKDVLEESSKGVIKSDELAISYDTTENENPNEENPEAVNPSAKTETAEIKTSNKNEGDTPIIHSSVEETLVGKVGGECDEVSNLESEKLKESLESVSEAPVHEILLETKQNEANQAIKNEVSNEEVHGGLDTIGTNESNEKQTPREAGSVEQPHLILVEEETVKENHQEDHKGEEFMEAATKSGLGEPSTELEVEEDQNGKTNEATETIKREIVNEEITGLENAGDSETNEKMITEENEAAKNPYEKWENKIKEATAKLVVEDKNHEVPCRDHTTENEEILQGLDNAGPSEPNDKLITEEDEAAKNPYEKWENQIKEAATKLDSEGQNYEAPCRDHTRENEELVLVETNSATTIPTETRETVIVKDEEGPNEIIHDSAATNASYEGAPIEEIGDKVVEVSAIVPEDSITVNLEKMTSANEDARTPKCFVEVDNLKNSSSELASKATVITEDLPLQDEAVPTKIDASVLIEASVEEIQEKDDKATEDEGRHVVKQALAEVGPLIEGREEQHIKDEAPVEEILKHEADKKLDEANIQENVCENEDTDIQIPKQEETQVSIAAEQATTERSTMASTDKISNTSDLVVEEQCQQVHESAKTETIKLEDVDSLNEKLEDFPNVQASTRDILEKETTMKLEEGNEIPQSVEKIEKSTDTTNEEQVSRKVALSEHTETNNSTSSTDTASVSEDSSGRILEKTNMENQKPAEISEIEQEIKGAEYGHDKDSISEPKPSDSDKISLSKLIQRSEKETPVEEKESLANNEALKSKLLPTIQVEEEAKEEEKYEEEEEEENEHKKEDSGSDAPVMVEASTDVDVKPTPKKSQSILSGVGSKVKHSIAKVKKAITGKSSHHKSTSPKKEKEKEKEDGSTVTLNTTG